jgi:tRNA A-37 threonylcarbamoyl transferase component Bud32/tetratricopeptide (TPR) repeat protein
MIGKTVGRYQVLAKLGEGGMGEVFLADDTQLQRRVAIKFLRAESEGDALARERLRREALAAAGLDHPFICKVYEIGDADGRTFIIMEYLEGETLYAAARRDLLTVRQIVEIANELAQALEEAHARGIVHRDLKPSNVMLTKQGHIKVMDFGLAKQNVESAATGAGSGAATVLTDSWTRIGTPAYMSPEQVLGSVVDGRSDIFSLGILLCELTTGAHPFMRSDSATTMAAILRELPSSGRRQLNSIHGFDSLVRRMLAKTVTERVQTMGELRVELEALRERTWQTAATRTATVESDANAIERTPFVARDAETTELRRLLDRMLAGHGGFALIGGEPGVGKTRLARELMTDAHDRGCLVVTGHCFEMEGTPPFAPFIESMEQGVRIAPQAVRIALGDIAPEIATIVPSLRRSYTDIPPSPEVPATQQRQLVFGAYLEFLRRATEASPAVVLFDDLHWADESTLQLLGHLAPHLASMRVLVLGTYRDVELDVKRPFAKTLESLFRQRFATRITLRRLTESGVHQMLSAMGGSAPPSALARVVYRETEGNPFFVEEVYQHLAEEGKLFDERGTWKADLRADTIDVPEGVRLVIGRRLERLGERAHKILTAAAVIGRTFPLDLLEAIVDVTPDDALDAVEEAERAQLVQAQPGREARYEFAHELIRTTLVSALSLPRRQRLHLKIADAMERLRAASLESHASVLAHHLYQAGAAADTQRTGKVLASAGRRAIAAGAFEEGLELFDHLLGLELPADDGLLADAWAGRGGALLGLQRPDDAIVALDEALTRYLARRDNGGAARMAHLLSPTRVSRGDYPAAVAMLRRVLAALSLEADGERAFVQAMLGGLVGVSQAQPDEGWRHLEEALAAAESMNQPALLGHVLNFKASFERHYLELDAASESGRRAMQLLRPEALWDRADLLWNVLMIDSPRGRFDDADAIAPELDKVARQAGHPFGWMICDMYRLTRELMRTGSLAAFLASCERAASGPVIALKYMFRVWAAMTRFYLGQIDQGLEELVSTLPHHPPLARGVAETQVFLGNAIAGRLEPARKAFASVIPYLPTVGRRNRGGVWSTVDAALGLTLIGDRELCGGLYPAANAWIETGLVAWIAVGPSIPSPQLTAGVAAHAAGLFDRARDHFETAIRQAHELPIRLLQPTARYWYGCMLLEDPRVEEQARGHAMLEEAAADFRTLEMVTYANLAEKRLRGT